ncbi:uncharacterized protein LOC135177084 [Pogoniulus pusillus]|uniref:uncharacterized protein LOC135177084 n=1 Tax=Pogoniulus pusillus TaxID=488313 RepID=UPI0030B9220C
MGEKNQKGWGADCCCCRRPAWSSRARGPLPLLRRSARRSYSTAPLPGVAGPPPGLFVARRCHDPGGSRARANHSRPVGAGCGPAPAFKGDAASLRSFPPSSLARSLPRPLPPGSRDKGGRPVPLRDPSEPIWEAPPAWSRVPLQTRPPGAGLDRTGPNNDPLCGPRALCCAATNRINAVPRAVEVVKCEGHIRCGCPPVVEMRRISSPDTATPSRSSPRAPASAWHLPQGPRALPTRTLLTLSLPWFAVPVRLRTGSEGDRWQG